MPISILLNAAGSLLPQAIGMVYLSGEQFGRFSLGYLSFALASSIMFSVLCDPWVLRERSRGGKLYGTLSGLLSLVLGSLTTALSLLATGDVRFTIALIPCVVLAVFRVANRHFWVHERDWKRTVRSDALLCLGGLAGFIVGHYAVGGLPAVLISWFAGSLAGNLGTPLPSLRLRRLQHWIRSNGDQIRTLLTDSVIMDAAAIGTPYLLLPFLSLSEFGRYRAVSNTSAPVRLLLTPIRPVILSASTHVASRQLLAKIWALAVVSGTAVGGGLILLGRMPWTLGALTEITPYAIPTAVYVSSVVLLGYYPVLGRSVLTKRQLLTGRLLQAVMGIALPLTGLMVQQLSGALWGQASACALSALIWARLVARRGKQQ